MFIPKYQHSIKYFLLYPLISVSRESTFSKLERVKSYLRSTTKQGRLNEL